MKCPFHQPLTCLSVVLLLCACETDFRSNTAGEVQHWGAPGEDLGEFTSPRAIASYEDRLYIIDKTGRLIVYQTDGTPLRSWPLPDQDRGTPTSIAVDSTGDLWIPDTHNSRILHYKTDGTPIGEIGSFGDEPGRFSFVTGVTHDEDGNYYVCEYGIEDRIQKFGSDGSFVKAFGGHGTGSGELRRPMAVVYHPSGKIFVSDAANHRIQCFSASGKFLTMWGERGESAGQFNYPYDVAVDDEGFLYVCEFGNHRVQKFTPNGEYLGQWGEGGTGEGQLYAPWGVAVDAAGTVYIADTGNHRIVVLNRSVLYSKEANVPGTT